MNFRTKRYAIHSLTRTFPLRAGGKVGAGFGMSYPTLFRQFATNFAEETLAELRQTDDDAPAR